MAHISNFLLEKELPAEKCSHQYLEESHLVLLECTPIPNELTSY